jgi:hypothetical protein
MKCAFCGKQIPDEPDPEQERCGVCRGGCRKVHCPSCGYANPVVPKLLKKITQGHDKE